MIIMLLKIIAALCFIASFSLVLFEILNAYQVPDSFNDETGEYKMCKKCPWMCEEDYMVQGEPGPGCKACPLRYRPNKRISDDDSEI